MSSELGSLDDVLSDDEMVSALADRRFDDLHGDEFGSFLADWCVDLDADSPSADTATTADLAEAASRRRSLRRAGRTLAAAAAVAAVCVGGLGISKMVASGPDHHGPVAADPNSTASQHARQLIWQQLGEARTALTQQHWEIAHTLLQSAARELPQVSAGDGHDALASWIELLNRAVVQRASLTSQSAPNVGAHTVAPHQLYKGGVPLPPSMDGTAPSAASSQASAHAQSQANLPMLPTTLPTLRSTAQQPDPSTQSPSSVPTSRVPAPTDKAPHHQVPNPQQPTHPRSSAPSSPAPTHASPTLPEGPDSPDNQVHPRMLPLVPDLVGSGDSASDGSATAGGGSGGAAGK